MIPGAGGLRGAAEALRRRLDGRGEPAAVNHVSLGSHCHMAQILKVLRLRTWSGPFDWIFSAPGMVRDCLEDDFALLLDRSELVSVPLGERLGPDITRCRHRTLGERHAIPFVFNHHDPGSVDADYRFLADGAARLRTALRRAEENRFHLLSANPIAPEAAAAICDILAQQPARFRLTVYAIEADQARQSVVEVETGRPDLRFLQVRTRSASAGIRFLAAEDDEFLAELVQSDAERVSATA